MNFFATLLIASLPLASDAAPSSADQLAVAEMDRTLNRQIMLHDAEGAADVYAPAFILTTSSGKTKDKAAMLLEIARDELSAEINETQDVEVRVVGDTAVLTGKLHQKGSYAGKPFDVTLRVTDTWVRTAGSWQLLAGHATVVPPIQ